MQTLSSAVGFAMKAGKLVSGDFAVERLVRAGKAKMVLLDMNAARNTCEKYERLCSAARLTCVRMPKLGNCMGKPGRMVAAVCDENFSNMIRKAHLDACSEDRNDRG